MKIAVISMIRESWGGSEELWYEMAKEALQQGHEVSHLSYTTPDNHPKLKELIVLGLKEYKRPGFQSRFKSAFLRFVAKIFYFLRKITNRSLEDIFSLNPDVVLYNGTCYSVAHEKKLLELLKTFWGIKFFILGHLNPEGGAHLSTLEIANIKWAYQRADHVFFVSERSKKNAQGDLGYIIPNAHIVKNPVNLKERSRIAFPKEGVPQMAIVGILVSVHKGQDIALRVLSNPRWQELDWHLNLYGSGPDEQKLKALVDEYQLGDKVTFHGKVSDVRDIWKTNHILLMPSRMEGMPLALVEAMLCGRPSVVTDVGGNAEWVRENIEGFIAGSANDDEFEEALERAFENRHRWEDLGIAAHERAIKLFDPDAGATLLKLIS